jgi:predicted lipoprotein with Yx(FWY)xxD motif
MKRHLFFAGLALALVLLAVGGWIVDASRPKPGHDIRGLAGSRLYRKGGSKMYRMKLLVALAAASAFAGGTATGGTKVAIAKSRLGSILVDNKGITLYDFVQDKGGKSSCYGACAALWPPLITKGKPVAGHGVRASLLGTTKRKDGKLEVTYNGHPLYYFVSDRKPGQTTGQGINQFGAPWWVLSAAGKEIHRG